MGACSRSCCSTTPARAARTGADGRYVAPHRAGPCAYGTTTASAKASRPLERAVRSRRPGQYQLQAAITALHVSGRSDPGRQPTGHRFADLYAAPRHDQPVTRSVGVNHAAAVGFAHGPRAGLRLLRPLLTESPPLDRYQPLHATHAEFLRQDGDLLGAAHAYQRAIELTEKRPSNERSCADAWTLCAARPDPRHPSSATALLPSFG